MTETTDKTPGIGIVIIVLFVAVVLWVTNLIYGWSLDGDDRGLFGDMFGAVNSIFSGFAFVGVTYAIFLQRQEVRQTKQDMNYTKEILAEQQTQLNHQIKEIRKQPFENTYFQMLKLFTDLTNQIDLQESINMNPITTKGKDVFPVFLKRIKNLNINQVLSSLNDEAMQTSFNKVYSGFYKLNSSELGHYFRVFYNIIKFIDHSDIDDKIFYSNLIRAQLSDSEVALIFYNGISSNGVEKLKPLIEKYALLKNLSDDDVYWIQLKGLYNKAAYGAIG